MTTKAKCCMLRWSKSKECKRKQRARRIWWIWEIQGWRGSSSYLVKTQAYIYGLSAGAVSGVGLLIL